MLLGLFLLAALAFPSATVHGRGMGNTNPGVLPPQSSAFGASYSEWNARWVQWAFSLPAGEHPLTDTADCSAGQSGHVWFFGGTFAGVIGETPNVVIGEAERECTIPPGTALFFPVVNAVCSTLLDPGLNEDELRDCAVDIVDHVIAMEAEIDGVPVQDLARYRALSPFFTYGPIPPDGLLDQPEGANGDGFVDGVSLMLAPLAVGRHTIEFSGAFEFTEEADGFDFLFLLDISYEITVEPAGRHEK